MTVNSSPGTYGSYSADIWALKACFRGNRAEIVTHAHVSIDIATQVMSGIYEDLKRPTIAIVIDHVSIVLLSHFSQPPRSILITASQLAPDKAAHSLICYFR